MTLSTDLTTIDLIINILGIAGTWITIVLVLLTLFEMQNQRKTSYKPDLVIPNMDIEATYNTEFSKYKLIWKTPTDDNYSTFNNQISIYNLGLGSAKNIIIEWKIDILEASNIIQSFVKDSATPLFIDHDAHNKRLLIRNEKEEVISSLPATWIQEIAFIRSDSISLDPIKIRIPTHYLDLCSYVWTPYRNTKETFFRDIYVDKNPSLNLPSINLEIQYSDLSEEKHVKKMTMQLEQRLYYAGDLEINQPVAKFQIVVKTV